MNSPPSLRLPGLDTLRALAVTLVVLHHYTLFVSHDADTFGWIGQIGWVGVDLFFALSGYLIGNQIFKAQATDAGLSLPYFYARRLLRTLPNYLLVLALYWLWPAWREDAPLLPLWRYLTFTQNLGLAPGSAFSHSWSLAIEEQFYLLLPALVLLGAALRWHRLAAWGLIAAVMIGGMLLRAELWDTQVAGARYGRYFYYQLIYYASLCRLDELLAGVALALLKHQYPGAWQRLLAHGRAALTAALLVLALACWLLLEDRYSWSATVFGYPLLALGFALLLVAALAPETLLSSLQLPGASQLARWSYAIYLTHRGVSALGAAGLSALGYGAQTPLAMLSLLALSVLAGWLLYRLVEAPVMAWRERLVPSNLKRAGGRSGYF